MREGSEGVKANDGGVEDRARASVHEIDSNQRETQNPDDGREVPLTRSEDT